LQVSNIDNFLFPLLLNEILLLIFKVSTEEGEALAKQLGCPFFETSAALRHFVDDAFHTLVKEIRARERNQMGNGSAKLDKQSKWRRFRNIFSVVFRKKEAARYQN